MHLTTQVAENHICISRSLFDEGMRATENKSYKKTVQKLALILLVLYLGIAVWLWYTGRSLFFLLGESIFLGALLFWLMIMLPGTRRRSKYKAMIQCNNGLPKRTVIFFQNYLSVIANTGKEITIPYTDVTGWQETKNLYILNCHNNTHVLLDKNGFITGNFYSIKAMLFKE